VFYSWWATSPNENNVQCFDSECTGVSVDRSAKVITFANTQVGDGITLGNSVKISTLNGTVTYP
jgi:hypothetical protein